MTLRKYQEAILTLGNGDVVRLTNIVVNSTHGVGQARSRISPGDQARSRSPGVGIHTETDFEGIRRVLNTAVARLLSDTDGVVLVGEMDSSSKVVTLQSPRQSGEPLSTS